MKELINSNVYNDNDSKEIIEATLDHITNRLTKTLGPYGSNTIISDKSEGHIVSKDGYTVLGRIKYNGVLPNTVLDMVKQVSRAIVKEVGDGSTSAIVVSNYLYKGIYKLKETHNIAPKEILDILNKLEELITEDVLNVSNEINEENFDILKNIAAISNNNDEKAGEVVYELYKLIGVDGFINIEDSDGVTDYYEISQGIEFSGGYIDRCFATEKNRVDTMYERPYVLMCNDVIDEDDMEMVAELVGKCASNGNALIVLAKGFDFSMQNFFKINRMQNRDLFKSVPVMYPLPSLEFQDRFEDLSIYLNATIYDKSKGMQPGNIKFEDLGMCDKITINEDKTTIVNEELSEEVENRILELEKFIEENDLDDVDRYKYKKRIAILGAKNATLYVGGLTQLEKENRKYLMEDAVYACQSAIKNGYVSGGNLIIPRIIRHNILKYHESVLESNLCKSLYGDDKLKCIEDIIDLVSNAFKQSYLSVLKNAYNDENQIHEILDKCLDTDMIFNLLEHEYEHIDDTRIINSVMTDIHIMKSSFSIVGLLGTANQFVTQEPCISIIN